MKLKESIHRSKYILYGAVLRVTKIVLGITYVRENLGLWKRLRKIIFYEKFMNDTFNPTVEELARKVHFPLSLQERNRQKSWVK